VEVFFSNLLLIYQNVVKGKCRCILSDTLTSFWLVNNPIIVKHCILGIWATTKSIYFLSFEIKCSYTKNTSTVKEWKYIPSKENIIEYIYVIKFISIRVRDRVMVFSHRPVASHWYTLSYNLVSSTPRS
jgi:hypothetical protein